MNVQKLSARVATGALTLVAASAAQADFFTDEATFLSNINPTFYLEDFSDHVFGSPLDGSQTEWDAPGANGFGWTASAALGLFSSPSALSTNFASDPLTITFTGNPVTAFGGNFTGADFNGKVIPSTVTVNLSNGESQVLRDPTGSSFLGWTGTVAIVSITVNAEEPGVNTWPTIDHFYAGTAGGGTPCSEDTNGDNAVDVDDLIAVILGWGCTGTCTADVNDDNVVDVDDLIAVVLAWGPC